MTKVTNSMSTKGDYLIPVSSKTVRRLDNYPELMQALRDGDVLSGRMLCARLFDPDLEPAHSVD